MNKREVGTEYEELAINYLREQGIKILERNFRNRQGEIDIIGKDGEYVVFIEVKFRRNEQKGNPVEAVNFAKQKNICKVADYYRMIHGLGEFSPIRYDVIAICNEQVEWYKNAFYHIFR